MIISTINESVNYFTYHLIIWGKPQSNNQNFLENNVTSPTSCFVRPTVLIFRFEKLEPSILFGHFRLKNDRHYSKLSFLLFLN